MSNEIKDTGKTFNGRRVYVAKELTSLTDFLRATGQTFVQKRADKEGVYRCYCNFEAAKEDMVKHLKSFGRLTEADIEDIMKQAEKPEFSIVDVKESKGVTQ